MGQLKLDVGMFGKTAGFALVGAAILATAIHIHRVERPGRWKTVLVAADPLAPELARCQAIGVAAETDRTCDAAWAENRHRFFDGSAAAQPANRLNTVNTLMGRR